MIIVQDERSIWFKNDGKNVYLFVFSLMFSFFKLIFLPSIISSFFFSSHILIIAHLSNFLYASLTQVLYIYLLCCTVMQQDYRKFPYGRNTYVRDGRCTLLLL